MRKGTNIFANNCFVVDVQQYKISWVKAKIGF